MFECLRIEASKVTQPSVGVVSQRSGNEISGYLEFRSK